VGLEPTHRRDCCYIVDFGDAPSCQPRYESFFLALVARSLRCFCCPRHLFYIKLLMAADFSWWVGIAYGGWTELKLLKLPDVKTYFSPLFSILASGKIPARLPARLSTTSSTTHFSLISYHVSVPPKEVVWMGILFLNYLFTLSRFSSLSLLFAPLFFEYMTRTTKSATFIRINAVNLQFYEMQCWVCTDCDPALDGTVWHSLH